jgi:hypothetical protein
MRRRAISVIPSGHVVAGGNALSLLFGGMAVVTASQIVPLWTLRFVRATWYSGCRRQTIGPPWMTSSHRREQSSTVGCPA